MEKKAIILIEGPPEDIAKGLKIYFDEYYPKGPGNPEPDFKNEKMTVGQGAHFIDVSYPTLCNWINDGKVPIHGKGRTRFLLKSELIEAYKNLNNNNQ